MERGMTAVDTTAELVMTFRFRFNITSWSLNANVEALYTEIDVLLYSTEMTVDWKIKFWSLPYLNEEDSSLFLYLWCV